jgi:hypothetical protein
LARQKVVVDPESPEHHVEKSLKRFVWTVILILAVVFVPTAACVAVTIHDEHVRNCYPPKDKSTQHTCNWTFPLHDHPMED